MQRSLICVFLGLLVLPACHPNNCKVDADCATGDLCVQGLLQCRKYCTKPIDCSGSTVCTAINAGPGVCLTPGELQTGTGGNNNDTSLGEICYSPTENGVSAATGGIDACGSSASTCTPAFGKQDVSNANLDTCTTDCATDSDCAADAPPSCTGDCLAAYNNLCCIPQQPAGSAVQFNGNVKGPDSNTMPLYCRPRLMCYLVPKRCKQDADCGKTGSRAGATCTKTSDGGGACTSGKLAAYECCQRDGECDQAPGGNAMAGYNCQPSLDFLSAYCSRPCASDADCQLGTQVATASCWTTTYEEVDGMPGQCRVVMNPTPVCRSQTAPPLQSPPTKLVPCAYLDRPAVLSDNHYDDTKRRCARTF